MLRTVTKLKMPSTAAAATRMPMETRLAESRVAAPSAAAFAPSSLLKCMWALSCSLKATALGPSSLVACLTFSTCRARDMTSSASTAVLYSAKALRSASSRRLSSSFRM